MFVVWEKIVQRGVCLGHDDQEHTIDNWLLKQIQLLHQASHGTHVWRAQFDGVNVFVCPLLLLVMVIAEVSRMAVHSATVACKNRGHSESGIKCRGSSSIRVILVAAKPVSFD